MTAEEIRDLYLETLARACYEKPYPAVLGDEPKPPWEDQPEEVHERFRGYIAYLADTLAAAGLLPTGAKWGAGGMAGSPCCSPIYDEGQARQEADAHGGMLQRKFLHDYREVPE